jgi:hypothetical protein
VEAGLHLSEWEQAFFRRFAKVCLDGEGAVTQQLQHATVAERKRSPESGMYLRVEVVREHAAPFEASSHGPFTLYADDLDGPFIEVLFWLDDGYLSSFEGWKQETKPGQISQILQIPDAEALQEHSEYFPV